VIWIDEESQAEAWLSLFLIHSTRETEMNAEDITRAVVSGNYLDFYWALKRHPPQQVWQVLSGLDAAVAMAFITGLINDWYRLRAALDAANEALDVGA
jgi:hypothetical protein